MLISFKLATNQVRCIIIQCGFSEVIGVFVRKVNILIRFGDFKKIKSKPYAKNMRIYTTIQLKTMQVFLRRKTSSLT